MARESEITSPESSFAEIVDEKGTSQSGTISPIKGDGKKRWLGSKQRVANEVDAVDYTSVAHPQMSDLTKKNEESRTKDVNAPHEYKKERSNVIPRLSFKRARRRRKSNNVLDDCSKLLEHEAADEFPTLTKSEILRFKSGRTTQNARQKMTAYVNWRTKYNIETPTPASSDKDTWNRAASYALTRFDGGGAARQTPSTQLPRILRFGDDSLDDDWTSCNGHRVVQVLPGLIDTRIAPLDAYVLCSCLYLDAKLDRDSTEQAVVLIDVRAGKGWPNPSPMALIPYVKQLCRTLADIMPERLCHCVVYPVPFPARLVWAVFKGFLDPKHVQKVKIFWGMAMATSPAPKKQMREFFDDQIIEGFEA
eukprot:CAMPEP_0172521782 /NCGR_PEP_ID=MMETSP1066-20121228/292775_1 /TAXON_ID=671091 /ORGANISM="Coscinodiscus wailesii, Strain CCMP2513" /LENGTH=363 /DNA_ID=CAMNT_0013304739 /DNA_START=321 /DNA_END=1409 /DNA_ORIENTATION=-